MPVRSMRASGRSHQSRGERFPRPGGVARAVRIALAVLVLGSLSIAGIERPAAGASPNSTLGIYVGPGDPGTADSLAGPLGGHLAYAMDFLDPSSWSAVTNPTWPVQVWAGHGYQMIWGVPMLPNSGGSMASGAAGAYDGNFRTLAQNFVAQGQGSSIIRIGWEFNGSWFPWGTSSSTPAQFAAYWIHIVNAMRSVPGANFRFEWNPTLLAGTPDPSAFYPGNSYVDIIGLDVYDTEWATYPGSSAEFAHMVSEPFGLNWLNTFSAAHGKPMAFPEWGLGWGPSAPNSGPVSAAGTEVSGGDDPGFVANMAGWIKTHNVVEATFWDYGTSRVDNGQNPLTLAALGADFAPGVSGNAPPTAPTTGSPGTSPTAPNPGAPGSAPVTPSTDSGPGYLMTASDGGVFSFGTPSLGSLGGQHLNAPIVGMAFDPATGGYYEVASDGGIFAFGAPYRGSMGGQHLNAPIVGMDLDPTTGGYYEVASDGGVFAFGAPSRGSMGGQHLNAPIVGIAS